jgi:hypothetical protein
MPKPLIAIIIPTRGTIMTRVITAVAREMASNLQQFVLLTTEDIPLPDSRNRLVEEALMIEPVTHLLLIDDDVVISPQGLKKMLELDCDIAVIDYPMHTDPDNKRIKDVGNICYNFWLKGQSTKDKPIYWAGLGCVLVKREVFKKMGYPWFQMMHRNFQRNPKTGEISFIGKFDTEEHGGEDCYFFMNANKLGFKIKQVEGMTCEHMQLLKTVLPLQAGKYKTFHKILSFNKIEKPFQ